MLGDVALSRMYDLSVHPRVQNMLWRLYEWYDSQEGKLLMEPVEEAMSAYMSACGAMDWPKTVIKYENARYIMDTICDIDNTHMDNSLSLYIEWQRKSFRLIVGSILDGSNTIENEVYDLRLFQERINGILIEHDYLIKYRFVEFKKCLENKIIKEMAIAVFLHSLVDVSIFDLFWLY